MQRIIYSLILATLANLAWADNYSDINNDNNNNSKYINPFAYIQDPYISLTSFGGTAKVSESQIITQNVAEKLFSDGTWNMFAGAASQYTATGIGGYPNYAYGVNLFGQTGQVAGFSIGGLLTVLNPFFATNMNGSNMKYSPFLPADKQVTPSEAFIEYQFSNIVQADLGWIGINNSPWLAQNYNSNLLGPGATYQGGLINIYPGGGWLITALAFNASQATSETGFSGLTFYNRGFDYAGGLIASSTTAETSAGTLAVGANYYNSNNQYNLRLWGYQFNNYGSLLYADNSIKFNPSQNLSFSLASQLGSDNSVSANAFTNNNNGQISSNFVGIQGGLSYKIFSLNLGYNTIWGPTSAFGSGAIVSPYTYGFATDPLYTTPYIAGLVDMGTAGSAYKISPSLNLMNGNLVIAPAFTSFATSSPDRNGTSEYDFTVNYSIPEIKGLNIFAAYAYQSVPAVNMNPSNSTSLTQLFVTYLY